MSDFSSSAAGDREPNRISRSLSYKDVRVVSAKRDKFEAVDFDGAICTSLVLVALRLPSSKWDVGWRQTPRIVPVDPEFKRLGPYPTVLGMSGPNYLCMTHESKRDWCASHAHLINYKYVVYHINKFLQGKEAR